MIPEATDAALLAALKAGSEAAFVALYRRHQGSVYRFAWHMSGDRALADEAAQETFLALLRSAGKFDVSRGPLEAWLLGIARRQVLGHLRRESGYVALGEGAHEEASHDEDLLAGLERRERVALVRTALLQLPVHFREAVVLCDLEERDYEAAAAILACPIGTLRSRLHRGRALLKRVLLAKDSK